MNKLLIVTAIALGLSACAELGAAFDVMDAITTPTDREVCESDLHNGKWIDGACYSEAFDIERACRAGVVKDGVCYEKDQ